MPTPDAPPARRWPAIGAVLLAGLALGAALGSGAGAARLGELPPPTPATLALALAGLIAGTLALLSPLALRLLPALALYAVAGLALTRWGSGPGVAFAAGPVLLWAARVARTNRGSQPGGLSLLAAGLFLGFVLAAPRLYFTSPLARWTIPTVALVVGLALAGVVVVLVSTRDRRPAPARFDLRAALALAAIATVGLIAAFGFGTAATYVMGAQESGGLGMGAPSAFSASLLAGFGVGISRSGPGRVLRLLVGLGLLSLGFLFSAVEPVGFFAFAYLIAPLAAPLALQPALRRAERVHEALGVGTLLIATLLGMPLAASLVRGFTRLLPGAVPGIGAATRTDWPLILGFYGLLALVVLLAHLAHAYEFGLAALDPDDDRDPLPILRKGFQMKKKS